MEKDLFVYKELKTQENRLKYIRALVDKRADVDFLPRRIFIEPTNHCNCKCVHCACASHMTREKGYLQWDLYTKLIDEIAEHWPYLTVNLYKHGEPLLHPRIYDMIDYAQDKKLFVKVNSNFGALKKKDIPRLLKLNYLEISVDAATRSTYKKIKGRDQFDTVVSNILEYLEAWGETATHSDYACDISFLQQHANYHEAELFKDMFSRLPCGHVNIFQMHNFTGAIEEGDEAVPEDRDTLPMAEWPCCNSPWDVVGMNWDGSIVSCIYDFDTVYPIGNLNDQPLLDAWNGKRMQDFRQALLDRRFDRVEKNGTLCSKCSILWLPDYAAPTDYYKELTKMPQYLCNAIDRVSQQVERHEELMQRWDYLKTNKELWLEEFYARMRELPSM